MSRRNDISNDIRKPIVLACQFGYVNQFGVHLSTVQCSEKLQNNKNKNNKNRILNFTELN